MPRRQKYSVASRTVRVPQNTVEQVKHLCQILDAGGKIFAKAQLPDSEEGSFINPIEFTYTQNGVEEYQEPKKQIKAEVEANAVEADAEGRKDQLITAAVDAIQAFLETLLQPELSGAPIDEAGKITPVVIEIVYGNTENTERSTLRDCAADNTDLGNCDQNEAVDIQIIVGGCLCEPVQSWITAAEWRAPTKEIAAEDKEAQAIWVKNGAVDVDVDGSDPVHEVEGRDEGETKSVEQVIHVPIYESESEPVKVNVDGNTDGLADVHIEDEQIDIGGTDLNGGSEALEAESSVREEQLGTEPEEIKKAEAETVDDKSAKQAGQRTVQHPAVPDTLPSTPQDAEHELDFALVLVAEVDAEPLQQFAMQVFESWKVLSSDIWGQSVTIEAIYDHGFRSMLVLSFLSRLGAVYEREINTVWGRLILTQRDQDGDMLKLGSQTANGITFTKIIKPKQPVPQGHKLGHSTVPGGFVPVRMTDTFTAPAEPSDSEISASAEPLLEPPPGFVTEVSMVTKLEAESVTKPNSADFYLSEDASSCEVPKFLHQLRQRRKS